MRIGLDLDNTIVCYDRLFHEVAVECNLIPPSMSANKTLIRDHFRNIGDEAEWTRLQGIVYGEQMHRATAFKGFVEFVAQARSMGRDVNVISHRTRTPYLGPEFDLHEAAARWLAASGALIEEDDVYFEVTREAKMSRISQLECQVFVDDLPELLSDEQFPKQTRRVWFNPSRRSYDVSLESVASWRELTELLLKG